LKNRPLDFLALANNKDARDWAFSNKSHVSIAYTFELEERYAATYSGYTWQEYQQLIGSDMWLNDEMVDSKASVIAYYRMANRIEGIRNDIPVKRK